MGPRQIARLVQSDESQVRRYTAREGGARLRTAAAGHVAELVAEAATSGLLRLFSLRHDFPMQWNAFVNGTDDLRVTIRKEHFPYFATGMAITVTAAELYAVKDDQLLPTQAPGVDPAAVTTGLADNRQIDVSLPEDGTVLVREDATTEVFLLFRYTVS